jgi:glycopeptide antibiotics resistance protein
VLSGGEDMNSFDSYLNKLISKLDCNESEKECLRLEFEDHLEMLKSEYLNKGYSEKEAHLMAIKDFGDQELLSKDLNHSFSKTQKLLSQLFKVSWYMYMIVLARILLVSSRRLILVHYKAYNFIPFKQISQYILNFHRYNFDIWFLNLFGNIIFFMPFGFLLPLVYNKGKTIGNSIILATLFSSSIEILQYILELGIFDIDDIILNVIGSIIGFIIYKTFINILKSIRKDYWIKSN